MNKPQLIEAMLSDAKMKKKRSSEGFRSFRDFNHKGNVKG